MHISLSLYLSLSDYLSLHSQQSVFVYLSVIKTLTIFLRRVESAHACLPFILCVSLYLCLSLVSVCLSICLSLSIIVSLKKALVCFHQNLSKIEQEQEILNRRRQQSIICFGYFTRKPLLVILSTKQRMKFKILYIDSSLSVPMLI